MHKGKIGWQPLIAATQFNSRRITILWVNIVQPQYFHLLHCTSRAYMLLYSKNRNCICLIQAYTVLSPIGDMFVYGAKEL